MKMGPESQPGWHIFPGKLILNSPRNATLSVLHVESQTSSAHQVAQLWFVFSFLAVTVDSSRNVPRVCMHGFSYKPWYSNKNGGRGEPNELWLCNWKSNQVKTKQKDDIPGKQSVVSEPKMGMSKQASDSWLPLASEPFGNLTWSSYA